VIRWYDYALCIGMADIMLVNIKIALFAPSFVGQLSGGVIVWALLSVWDSYCLFRLKQERKKK
jgi:hypothetical protein